MNIVRNQESSTLKGLTKQMAKWRTGRLHGRSFVSIFILLGERDRPTNLGRRSWPRVERGCGCGGFHQQPVRAPSTRRDGILVLVIVSISAKTKFNNRAKREREKRRKAYLLSTGYRRSSASLSLDSIRLSSNSGSSTSLDTDDLDPCSGSLDLTLESSSWKGGSLPLAGSLLLFLAGYRSLSSS